MEECKQKLTVAVENKFEEKVPTFTFLCVEYKGHTGQHQALSWTDGYNKVTKKRGIIKYIFWDCE